MKFMEVKERGKVFAYCGILFLMLGMALLVLFGGDVLAWAGSYGPYSTYTPYANLTFEKTWLDEDGNTASPPENTEVTFTVTLEAKDGRTRELKITLNKGNNWSYNLLDNRKAIEDEYGIDVADYYYKEGSISEFKVNGYTYGGADVSPLPDGVDGVNHIVYKNYTITLKNMKEPAPARTTAARTQNRSSNAAPLRWGVRCFFPFAFLINLSSSPPYHRQCMVLHANRMPKAPKMHFTVTACIVWVFRSSFAAVIIRSGTVEI